MLTLNTITRINAYIIVMVYRLLRINYARRRPPRPLHYNVFIIIPDVPRTRILVMTKGN